MQEKDKTQLKNQQVEVVKCENEDCGHLMANVDADQLAPGDLALLKKEGVRISNPETDKPYCLNCDAPATFGERLASWFDDEEEDKDDSFFSRTPSSSGSLFGGSSSFGGFGGGFGFGGGGFGGGGAARGF